MHIVLMILKIIGIILAVMTVLLVFILLIPFSYVGNGEFKEKSKATFVLRGFLSTVYFKFTLLDTDMNYVLRIFGIPFVKGVLGADKEEPEKKEELHHEQGVEKYAGIVTIEESEDELVKENPEITKDKISTIKDKLKDFIEKIKTIPGKVKDIKVRCSKVKKILKSKKAKIAYYYAKEKLLKTYKHIKPKKVEANIIFGFDSPDKTGKVLAALGMVCGTINIDTDKFQIVPDFQEKRLEGTAFIKGRFVLGYLVIQFVKLYFKREIRIVIEALKKEIFVLRRDPL